MLLALVLASALAVALVVADSGSERAGWRTPVPTGFPRTGIWWPDTAKQPLADIARYDYVVLGDWQYAFAPRIKALHSDCIVLGSTGACEPGFADLGPIPAKWLLTEVGTRLSSPVDATSATLQLRETVGLFHVGDAVVLGDEVAKVRAVGDGTVTLDRGAYKPAAAHPAGTRVAAALSFWPGNAIADLTTSCPHATVDPSVGPETWGEYNARHAASEIAANPALDGMLVDRTDGYESWLVKNGVVGSIDASRMNSPPGDGYAAFDAAWNAGLRAYEERIRKLVGNRILLGNGAYPNMDLLNGTAFETFPSETGGWNTVPWRNVVYGPRQAGSYMQWTTYARQPNLTTVLTYEDESAPAPSDDPGYHGRGTQPGFVPDYRKMRYGLTSALMGDGFFAYEIATNGQASLGLMWFDEYDGAGKGPGYLGMPLGPARELPATPGVYRRDFEGGVALVNTTDSAARADMGATFQKLRGTQVPSVNDGSRVRVVSLPPRDGMILVRTAPR